SARRGHADRDRSPRDRTAAPHVGLVDRRPALRQGRGRPGTSGKSEIEPVDRSSPVLEDRSHVPYTLLPPAWSREGGFVRVTPLDYAVLASYFAVVLGIGFVLKSRMRHTSDFLMAGRTIPAWAAG